MISKKDRRHSGRTTPDLLIPKNIAIYECLEPQPFWDDWNDRRDGFRNWMSDGKKIIKISKHCDCQSCKNRIKWNKKNQLLLQRRKAKM